MKYAYFRALLAIMKEIGEQALTPAPNTIKYSDGYIIRLQNFSSDNETFEILWEKDGIWYTHDFSVKESNDVYLEYLFNGILKTYLGNNKEKIGELNKSVELAIAKKKEIVDFIDNATKTYIRTQQETKGKCIEILTTLNHTENHPLCFGEDDCPNFNSIRFEDDITSAELREVWLEDGYVYGEYYAYYLDDWHKGFLDEEYEFDWIELLRYLVNYM